MQVYMIPSVAIHAKPILPKRQFEKQMPKSQVIVSYVRYTKLIAPD
jgi:hypothetical protein